MQPQREAIRTRLTASNHAALSAASGNHQGSLGKTLNSMILSSDVETLTRAIVNRYKANEEIEEVSKRTSFLIEPSAIQHLNTLAMRTGLPVDLTVRLVIEGNSYLHV